MNSDTETFNALVESAALDIHAYIIQCNNRQYGDSRIRAPYKDRWKRDLLRVKVATTTTASLARSMCRPCADFKAAIVRLTSRSEASAGWI